VTPSIAVPAFPPYPNKHASGGLGASSDPGVGLAAHAVKHTLLSTV